jgi:hypothetical protein
MAINSSNAKLIFRPAGRRQLCQYSNTQLPRHKAIRLSNAGWMLFRITLKADIGHTLCPPIENRIGIIPLHSEPAIIAMMETLS